MRRPEIDTDTDINMDDFLELDGLEDVTTPDDGVIIVDGYTRFLDSLINEKDFNIRSDRMLQSADKYGKSEDEIHTDFLSRLEYHINLKMDKLRSDIPLPQRAYILSFIENWLKNFYPDPKNRKAIIDYYLRETNPPLLYGTDEFLQLANQKNEEANFIVFGLLPTSGLINLNAYSKVGKTSFAIDLLTSVATGHKWLGRKTTQSNVLFIQNEEDLKDTSKKVKSNKLGDYYINHPEEYERLVQENRIIVIKDVDIVEDRDYIFQLIKQNNIKLVVCDSLSASLKKCGYTESSTELTPELYKLQNLIHYNKVCFIMLHHNTKVENMDDVTSRLKSSGGRSGISRANDGQISLSLDKKDKSGNTISAFFDLRHAKGTTMTLERREQEACSWCWMVIDESVLSAENISLQNRIIMALKNQWQVWYEENQGRSEDELEPVYGMTLNEIMEDLNDPSIKQSTVVTRLNWMISNDVIPTPRPIKEIKSWLYHLDISGETWLDDFIQAEQEALQAKFMQEEADRQLIDEIGNCITRQDVDAIMKPLGEDGRKRIRKLMNEDEISRLEMIINPPLYPIGTLVKVKDTDIVRPVVDVKWNKKSSAPKNEKYKYTLRDLEQEFESINLEKVASLSE